MDDMQLKVVSLDSVSLTEYAQLLIRPTTSSTDMIAKVAPILEAVKTGGDVALRDFINKFDGCALASDSSFATVLSAPFAPELMVLPESSKNAIDIAYNNIRAFHQAQMDKESQNEVIVETMPGVTCMRVSRPIERVGLYVPGGTAVLPSTALMLGVPAACAACETISIATPPRPDGSISPEIVYIASLTGVSQIVKAGGAQAVAALAYGTESVSQVDKIFGPGNQWVTAAKMAVSMDAGVAIDMPAGPSEILVIADKGAHPGFVASDLVAQAEHGADSQVVVVGVDLDDEQVKAIQDEINRQALAQPRVEFLRKSLKNSLIVRAKDLEQAIKFSNAYAPEHLVLLYEGAAQTVARIKNAGSVFVGPWAPVPMGDYASGTNHTLPTAGFARQYSGVSTLSFLKHMTVQELTEEGIKNLGPTVETLARLEGLGAHEYAVTLRLDHLKQKEGK